MPAHDATKDGHHGLIIKLINGDSVEVTQETWGYRIAATTCTKHTT